MGERRQPRKGKNHLGMDSLPGSQEDAWEGVRRLKQYGNSAIYPGSFNRS